MTIGFSTHWPKTMTEEYAGKLTLFPEKILESAKSIMDFYYYDFHGGEQPLGCNSDDDIESINYEDIFPKHHTLREDPSDRWKVGMKIHPVINNRTKNRFQFAPVLEVKGIQKIEIKYIKSSTKTPLIYVGIESQKTPGYMLCLGTYNPELKIASCNAIEVLAINDGFESLEQFFAWFNKDWSGKIIHWTDLKY